MNELLAKKQPSWATLLRRAFSLFSVYCGQRGIPVFPICGAKVALYLSRIDVIGGDLDIDAEGEEQEPDSIAVQDEVQVHNHDLMQGVEAQLQGIAGQAQAAAAAAQDLDEHATDLAMGAIIQHTLDPNLASLTQQQVAYDTPSAAAAADVKAPRTTTPRPKKVLSKKTLEQYINRLTTLRTPTLPLWRERTGVEGETDSGLGVTSIIRDLVKRAGGEGSVDVKKRGRARGKDKGKWKKTDFGDGELKGDHGPVALAAGDAPKDSQANAAALQEFAVASTSGSHAFVIRAAPSPSASSAGAPSSSNTFPSVLSAPPGQPPKPPGSGETYTLSAHTFSMAIHYVRSLVSLDGMDQQRIGEIARSVEAAQGPVPGDSDAPVMNDAAAEGSAALGAEKAAVPEPQEISIDPSLS